MAVPDTTTFNLIDVKNNVTGSPNSLTEAFALADPDAFDPTYSGAKNNLLNFRNYDETPPAPTLAVSPESFDLGNSHSSQIITVTTTVSWSALVLVGGSWISISPDSGIGNGSFTATYTGGLSEGRTGTIRVSISGSVKDITVTEID